MKCTIPEISWHNRDPVLSVDLQAKNQNESFQRLASGGTDAHVVIWHIEIQQTGAASVEFAADLQRHQKAVNVVRFSPSGELLASGDDESVIIIWKQKTDLDLPEMPTAENEGNKEQWVGLKVLRGHVEDVYDLCWSPDSMNLISGSVDNSAILWDAQKGRNLGILRDHKGFVQGVAWDPLNKYVATLSSDRICRIYNIKTKKIVNRISKAQLPVPESSELHAKVVRLFHDDTLKSFFRRLCFSPDGQLLLVPSGIIENENSDKHGNATHVFTRRVLNRPSAFLPSNNQYTVAVRCCPVLFELRERETVFALPYRIVLAVATQKSILLYDTQQPEPFGIVSNIHYTRLTDLTWSQDGRMLIVSSTDGYCSIITFAEGELGQVYKSKENISTESREENPAGNRPSSEEGSVIRSKEISPDGASEAPQNTNVCSDKTKIKPLSEKNVPDEKSKNQEKTPEKNEISDKISSSVIPKERESVLSETPKHIKPVSAANSPSTLMNSPKCTASPSQKTPKRIKPILISKPIKSPKSAEQSAKRQEIHSKEPIVKANHLQEHPAASTKSPIKTNAESSEIPEKKIDEGRKDAPGISEIKAAAEKMEMDSNLPQTTVGSSTVIKPPSKTETKPPKRAQLITLSTKVSSKTNLETKKPAEKNISLISAHISPVKETVVPEKMEVEQCDAQEHGSDSVEKNSKQQESGKQTHEDTSEKKTTCVLNQIEIQAETECMEADEPENLPKGEVEDGKTCQKQLNKPEDKHVPETNVSEQEEKLKQTETKVSEQEEKLEQTSEKITVDSEKSDADKNSKTSFNDSSPHKKEENTVQEAKSSDEQLQGSSTPSHRTAVMCSTPSNVNTTPDSPVRNEGRPSSVTPGQEKRTPRRVQLITLSSPKSKKKLL